MIDVVNGNRPPREAKNKTPAKPEGAIVKIEIKNRWTGSVIFSHDEENNTMKTTLDAAVSARADLTRANLTRADLTDANLIGAKLTGADLTRANLTGANLTDANLTGANLTGANLAGANLTRADLTDADLTGADLTRIRMFGMLFGRLMK